MLPSIDLVDRTKFDTDAKIQAVSETFSLRDRRLEGAVLLGARLRKVNFAAARLQGAQLSGADLREAKFDCENRKLNDERSKECAQLQGARLDRAQLEGATIEQANLKGASFGDVRFGGEVF